MEQYDKLVRDRIPEIIEASGKTCSIHILNEKDYLAALEQKLDEEVAAAMVLGFGGVLTQLTQVQADYLGVPVEGPFKSDAYKY